MNQGYNTYYSQGAPQGGAYGGSADYYGGAAAAPAGGVGSGYGAYGAQAQPQPPQPQPQPQQAGAYGAAQATSVGSWSNTYESLGEYHSGVATAAPASSSSQGYYRGGAASTTTNSFQVGYDGYAQGVTAAATSNGGVVAGASNGSYAGVATMNAYNTEPTQPAQQPYYPPQPPQGGYYGNANASQVNSTPAAAAAPAPAALNTTDDNGLRWTWSCYPTTSKAKTKETPSATTLAMPEMVIPMSCMYTPLHPIEPSHLVLGAAIDELCCANCGAFCSMHSQREMGKYWVCLSCKRRNSFQNNTAITEQHPALMYETVEFVLANPPTPVVAPPQPQPAPAFIFVIDTCIPSGEMASLRTSLLESLQYLPRNALVGLISFGATVSVWELGASSGVAIRKCYLLRGNTANPPDSLQSMLQVSENHPVRGRLLAPLCDVEAVLTSLIEELEEDGAAVPSSKRPLRATSTALEATAYLMEALAPPQQQQQQQQYVLYGTHVKAATAPGGTVKMGKILLFTGGPCTRGPGAVVGTDKADMMRFHRDIIEGDTPYYEAAFNFYNALAPRLIAANTCLDVFAQSLDQVGVMEMRRCIDNTGGTLIVEDETTDIMFLESLKRYWQRCDLRAGAERALAAAQQGMSSSGVDGSYSSEDHRAHCGFAVRMEVNTSVGTLLRGALGPCNVDVEANKRGPTRLTSPLEVGAGGTTRWCVSYLDKGMTLSFLFDTATASNQQSGAESAHEKRFIQFVTRYTTPRGEQRVRVTSVVQPVAPPTAPPDYYTTAAAFDQTCAATIVARMAVSILEKHPGTWDAAKRWLDTLLVRFVRRYSTFAPGQPNTLRLSPCLSLFPSFMYNLRRSEYFMVLNISPDETTFKRHWLLRESVDNCVLMIQPTLDSYDLANPFATPMQLDSSSLRHDNIVLMDAYFNVHIMWGSIIYQWIEAAYHENPEYANFAELLEAAERDAQGILSNRYPYPRFSRTDADGSEARHVKTRVNPATNYHNSGMQYGAGPNGAVEQADVMYTDDASIMTFMNSLKKAVVTSDGKEEA